MPDRKFILTGPPGAGKTSVLQALPSHLHTVPEAARRVIAAQRVRADAKIGDADPSRFLRLMKTQCLTDLADIRPDMTCVFDRAVPDLVAYAALFGVPVAEYAEFAGKHRFEITVFWFPLWSEIYEPDEDRQATPQQLVKFSDGLQAAYQELRYQLITVPKLPVAERVRFITARIGP